MSAEHMIYYSVWMYRTRVRFCLDQHFRTQRKKPYRWTQRLSTIMFGPQIRDLSEPCIQSLKDYGKRPLSIVSDAHQEYNKLVTKSPNETMLIVGATDY